MSRMRSLLGRLAAALALGALTGVAACDDDGMTAPARCLDPALPLFDPAHAGAPADDNRRYVGPDGDHPCITVVGHSVSYVGDPPGSAAGASGVNPGAGGAGGAGAGGEGGGGD